MKNRGKVKWFDSKKGYGFIKAEDGTDVFVHWSGIVSEEKFKSISEGQTVEFDVIDVERGKQAVNVSVVETTTKEDFEKMMDTINSSAQKVLNGED